MLENLYWRFGILLYQLEFLRIFWTRCTTIFFGIHPTFYFMLLFLFVLFVCLFVFFIELVIESLLCSNRGSSNAPENRVQTSVNLFSFGFALDT